MEKIRERDLTWQIEEFMICCKSKDLRRKTMQSYEQTLRLFERWCRESLDICTVDEISENVIRHYIAELQERGKYTYYANDKEKVHNMPDRRRDFRTIAEQERLTIRQRQREGIDSAKGKGKQLGRPKASLPDNYNDIICPWKNGDITAKEAMTRLGIKKSTFYLLTKSV